MGALRPMGRRAAAQAAIGAGSIYFSARLDGAHQAYVRYFLPVAPVAEAAEPIAIAD